MLNVTDFENAELLDRDVTQEILLRTGADTLPLYAYLIANSMHRPTTTETFEWATDTLGPRRSQINNGPDDYDETTTLLVVDDGSIFYRNCLVLAEATDEVMLCTAVAGNTITVVRGIGSVVAAAAGSVANDAYLTNIGSAAGEGGGRYAAIQSTATLDRNVVQTFRKTVEVSGRAERTGTVTENERARQRRKKLEELSRDIEHALLFGAYDAGNADADGRRVTTTGGMLQAIQTNVDNIGGVLSWDRFREFCEMAFDKGAREKLCLAGPTFFAAVHTHALNGYTVSGTANVYGLRLSRVVTEWGDLLMYAHRGLKGVYAGHGIVIDPSQAEIRTLGGEKTGTGLPHLRPDVGENDQDGSADEWFAELGLQWGAEDFHALAKGVTVAG